MSNDFTTALRALLPGVEQRYLWDINSSLERAEMDLTQAIAEATAARDALRNARKATTPEHANTFLGEAFGFASHPGYSGTTSSNIESANAALTTARTSVQILDRFTAKEA